MQSLQDKLFSVGTKIKDIVRN